MSKLTDKDELEVYIDDLILNPRDHEEDDPLEVAGALIYAIQTRENFNVMFNYYLKNTSYSEKKQIKAIIKYTSKYSTVPITEIQNRLFAKLLEGLPKDKVAKTNEKRRNEEKNRKIEGDLEFLENVNNNFSTLKLKLGEQLKRKVVNNVTCEQLQGEILALQLRVQQLKQNANISIRKKAIQVASNVLDSEEQIQTKLEIIENNRQILQLTEEISSEELNKIQVKLATNLYAYSHIPLLREKSQEVLQLIRERRATKLTPDKMKDLSILEALKIHKQWDDSVSYVNPKFGQFSPEHITEGFYVMHLNREQEEQKPEKNDIKMHISIDLNQASQAMEIIHVLAQSGKYSDLINEYKIGDIEQINQKIHLFKEAMTNKLEQMLSDIPKVDIQSIIEELKAHYPNTDSIINRLKGQVPQDKQSTVESALKQIVSKELSGIISGERILNDALFTVYFNKDFSKESLKEFCQELEIKFQEEGIKKGNLAKTDVQVNSYCGITIDHILDENGKKIYLESDKPEHVHMRHKALNENPLTKDLIQHEDIPPPEDIPLPPVHDNPLFVMSSHVDIKDNNGMSAYIAKGLSEMPMEERVSFAGLLVSERFKQTQNVNLVYRNPDMYAKWVVKEIFNDLKFPVDSLQYKEFFQLVEKSVSSPPNEEAKQQLKEYFANPKPEVIQMLLPFYHEYLENVKKEFDKNYKPNDNLPRDEQRNEYYHFRELRLSEAKNQFLGHVSFPFVESLVFELQEKDGFSPERKGRLALAFRSLRNNDNSNDGIMNELIKALDQKNESYIPPKVKSETINKAFEIFETRNKKYSEVQRQHRESMLPIEQRATELYNLVNRIASRYPNNNELKALFQRIAGSIDNNKTELDHKLLRGEKITQQDVAQVQMILDSLMHSVKERINKHNERGDTLLHDSIRDGNKELTELLLKAGADPLMKTTHYKRGAFRALKDSFKGKSSDFFKNMLNTPPRNALDLAILYDSNSIEALQKKVDEIQKRNTEGYTLEELEQIEHLAKLHTLPQLDQSLDLEQAKSLGVTLQHLGPKIIHKSGYVAAWEIKIDDLLKRIRQQGDSSYIADPQKRESTRYLLTSILDILRFKSQMTKEEHGPLTELLNRILPETGRSMGILPEKVLKALLALKNGEEVTVYNTKGEKSEFAKAWEEVWEEAINDCKNSEQLGLERIKNFFTSNPAINKESLPVLKDMLDEVQKSYDISMDNINLINKMAKGDMPSESKKKHSIK